MANLTEARLAKRDSKRNIGDELLQAVRDIKAGRTGRKFHVEVTQADAPSGANASGATLLQRGRFCIVDAVKKTMQCH